MSLLLPYYVHLALMVLTGLLVLLLTLRIYLRRTVVFKCDDKLDGKTVVITGANSGIGQAVAVDLARRGARVVLACRDRSRRDSAPFAVRTRSGNVDVRFMYVDLSSLDSIVEFCRQFHERETRLDILINNAAVLCAKEWTLDGLDMAMGVNAFGHFLLTNLLLDMMKAGGGSRVVNVVSEAYKSGHLDMTTLDMAPLDRDYTMYRAYSASKLALVLLTKEMARRFKDDSVSVFAVDPGSVNTKLLRHWPGWPGQFLRGMAKLVSRTPEEGAQTILHCALANGIENHSGRYFYNCSSKDIGSRYYKNDDDFGRQLWDKMQTVLKSKNFSIDFDEYRD